MHRESATDFSVSGQTDLDLLLEFLRFRSVSTKPDHAPDMRACAEWLCRLLSSNGLSAELADTGGHPAVVARGPEVPGKPTVLIYGRSSRPSATAASSPAARRTTKGKSSPTFSAQFTLCGKKGRCRSI